MRISTMRDLLEQTAIDHVYYRTYDPDGAVRWS